MGGTKPRGVMPPSSVAFLAHVSMTKHLVFVCQYVEPFQSYELLTDGGLVKVRQNLRLLFLRAGVQPTLDPYAEAFISSVIGQAFKSTLFTVLYLIHIIQLPIGLPRICH